MGETHPPRAIRQLVNEALAALDVEYGPTSIAFSWIGFDEMDEVRGEGNADAKLRDIHLLAARKGGDAKAGERVIPKEITVTALRA